MVKVNVDVGDRTYEGADEERFLDPGHYRGMYRGSEEDQKRDGVYYLKFEITAPSTLTGRAFRERIQVEGFSSEGHQAAQTDHICWIAKRLGLVQSDEEFARGEFDLDSENAIGLEFGLILEENVYKDKDDNKKTTTRLRRNGIVPPDSDELDTNIRLKDPHGSSPARRTPSPEDI